MNSFLKYDSIDNTYAFKINNWLDSKLHLEQYVIQEKLDGSNISFIFLENGRVKVASRNNYLGCPETTDFFGISQVIKTDEFANLLEYWSNKAKYDCCEYQLYGEIYGKGIQNRIEYGSKKIKFFDIRRNGHYLAQSEFYRLMEPTFTNFIVPLVGMANSLEEALSYSENFQTLEYAADFDNPAEGIVIKPWNTVVRNRFGERFVLKKKSDKFSEKSSKKSVKEEKIILPAVQKAQEEFALYINENRVLSYFSKEGRLESMKDISKYIPAILNDALLDYMKDNALEDLGKEERKNLLTHVTKDLVQLLKDSLTGKF